MAACATRRRKMSWPARSSQCAGSASTTSRQICFSRESKLAGGSGRPCPGTMGTTESEAADLRPRGMDWSLRYSDQREILAQNHHLVARGRPQTSRAFAYVLGIRTLDRGRADLVAQGAGGAEDRWGAV